MTFKTALLAAALLPIASAAFPATAPAIPRDSVDASLPTQLPRGVTPRHYAIDFTPNAAKLTFEATIAIDLEVEKATSELVMNAANLNISSAKLTADGGQPVAATSIRPNPGAETISIGFPRSLQPGAYRLDMIYSGKINTQANGLFALDYKNKEGADARGLFTQFQAADARRFFPGWDEPDYRATFDLTARVPAAELAVSNMPVASSKPIAGGLKEVRFETSPSMSTYLLFFASGDLERIARKTGGAEVGIVMSRGNADQAQYALDSAAEILPYYDDYFGRPYPLPKLDNIAGPGQSQFFLAMENWGAIFSFEKVLLNDPSITTEGGRQAIYSIEAHEIAHMWFGDLVTMAWWNDLWLNEGFASWLAAKTTHHFHPDWGADVQQVASREQAMALDAFSTTHPIILDIKTVEQANQSFDPISYEKGESVISMLEGYAGADVWRDGIRKYINAHAYRNTTTSDLWSAVEAAGAKGLTRIAQDFTTQPGIPLISVGKSSCMNGSTTAELVQGQFSNDRREQVSARPLSWRVPVRAMVANGKPVVAVTDGRTTRIEVPGCGPLLINPGQTGYYRTLYGDREASALAEAFPSLNAVDQYGSISNSFALSRAGYQPMGRALDLLAAVPSNSHPLVAQNAINNWMVLVQQMNSDPAAQAAIRARVIREFGPRLDQLGFVPKANEAPTDALLRPTLIAALANAGDPRVLAEAKRLFDAWQTDPQAIPGSLKTTWLSLIAQNASGETWEKLRQKASRTSGVTERTTLYELLGTSNDAALADKALALALTDEPGKTVSAGIISAVAGKHSIKAFDFSLAHLGEVTELIDIASRTRYFSTLAQQSDDPAVIGKLEAFAAANVKPNERRVVDSAKTAIRYRTANLPRIRKEVRAWLDRHGGVKKVN